MRKKIQLTDQQLKLLKFYFTNDYTMESLADSFLMSRSTIFNFAKKHGWKRKTKATQRSRKKLTIQVIERPKKVSVEEVKTEPPKPKKKILIDGWPPEERFDVKGRSYLPTPDHKFNPINRFSRGI